MQHPDEGMIHTWLDGELPVEEAAALEAHASTCEQCKAAIAEARGFVAASSRIISSLDAVPGGVIPAAKPVKRMWYASQQFRAAAAVLVVAGASLLVLKTGSQKATMSVSARSEANDASTAQRVISANGPALAAAPATAQPPAVADQAATKVEAAKAAAPPRPREVATPRAPAAPGNVLQKAAANEADFSGKGVKGGAAYGVAAGVPMRDTSAIVSEPSMKAADALRPRAGFSLDKTDLKVLRVDSSAIVKNTIYQSPSGKQVVLTEQPAELGLSEVRITGTPAQSRKTAARSAPTAASPPVAPVPAAPAPAAPAPAVQNENPVHTITWMDASTRRRYTLSGPVSVEELETIKARLLLTRH